MIPTRRSLRCRGLVLKTWRSGEKDVLASLFTREFGRVQVLAKGGRHTPSRFGPFLQPASTGIYALYRGPNRVHVTACDRGETLVGGNLSGEALLLTQEILLVLAALLPEEKPHEHVFDMSLKLVLYFGTGQEIPLAVPHAYFLKLLSFLGVGPTLARCQGCDQPLGAGTEALFSPVEGGLFCRTCPAPFDPGAWRMEGETLDLIRFLHGSTFAEIVSHPELAGREGAIKRFYSALFAQFLGHELSLRCL